MIRRALLIGGAALALQGCALPLLVGGGAIGGYAAAPRDAEGRKCYGFLGCYETGEGFRRAVGERDQAATAPEPGRGPARRETRR